MKGVRYFSCGAKRGVFVRPDKVLLDKRGRSVRNNNPKTSTENNMIMRKSISKGSYPSKCYFFTPALRRRQQADFDLLAQCGNLTFSLQLWIPVKSIWDWFGTLLEYGHLFKGSSIMMHILIYCYPCKSICNFSKISMNFWNCTAITKLISRKMQNS